MRASISSVEKVLSLAGLFWVDESSDKFEFAGETSIETVFTAGESSAKELETVWSGDEYAISKPGV